MIGAFAAHLWINRGGKNPYRGTRDIDLVIGVPDYDTYSAIRDKLAEEWGRVQGIHGRHTLILDNQLVLDLLPFDSYVTQRSGTDFT